MKNLPQPVRLELRERLCEACGPSPLRPVCAWTHIAATRSQRWRFESRTVLCENCGFAFLSPCYSPEDLGRYYADSYARFSGQSLDFSPAKRLEFIRQVLSRLGRETVQGVIELGGNAATSFQEELRARYGSVAAYEPNAECGSDFNDLGQVPAESYELLVHYFILEHVAAVRPFLAECRRVLRPGGVMIVEVPDLMLYPEKIDALILHEHCNHFTPENLHHLAALEGFGLVETSHELCSRPFGFVAAFEKLAEPGADPFRAEVFARNLEAITAGVQRVEAFQARVKTALAELRALPEAKVVLWGANDNLIKMLPAEEQLDNAVLVDSDPRKRHYHGSMEARTPDEAVEALRSADRLILFTRLHAPAILDWIERNAGRRFAEVLILDY